MGFSLAAGLESSRVRQCGYPGKAEPQPVGPSRACRLPWLLVMRMVGILVSFPGTEAAMGWVGSGPLWHPCPRADSQPLPSSDLFIVALCPSEH